MVFLPGFLLCRILRLDRGAIRTCLSAFALSLILNHFGVVLLTSVSLYTRSVVLAIVLAEMGFLVWFVRKDLLNPITDLFKADRENLRLFRREWEVGASWAEKALLFVVFALSIWVVAYHSGFVLTTVGKSFSQWDALMSWNRWAIDWAANRTPYMTYRYPQLLPTNWSVVYVLAGSSDLWMFPRWLMPLFPLALLFGLVDLGLRTRGRAYWFALPAVGWLMALLPSELRTDGYADAAIASLSFMPIYLLISWAPDIRSDGNNALNKRLPAVWLAGALMAVAASQTKQQGLVIAALYPVYLYWFFLTKTPLGRRQKISQMIKSAALILVLAAPWYLYVESTIRAGWDYNVLPDIVTLGRGSRQGLEHLWHAVEVCRDASFINSLWPSQRPGAICLVLLALGLLTRRGCQLAIVGVGWFILWAVFLSYDIRNISLALPFAGLIIGHGAAAVSRLGSGRANNDERFFALRIDRVPLGAAALLLVAVVLYFSVAGPNKQTLLDRQTEQLKTAPAGGIAEIKQALHDSSIIPASPSSKILTNYFHLGFDPDLRPRYVYCSFNEAAEIDSRIRDTGAEFICYYDVLPSWSHLYFDQQIERGRFTLIWRESSITLLKVNAPSRTTSIR